VKFSAVSTIRSVTDHRKARELDDDTRIRTIALLEKLNFRYYGTGIASRSDTGQGHLFGLAFVYYHHFGKEHEDRLIDTEWLARELVHFVSTEANDQKFIQQLTLDKDEAGNYFNWGGLKFFLANYEDALRSKAGESSILKAALTPRDQTAPNDFYHREHILADQDFTAFNDQDERDISKRRLGNFLLLRETTNIRVSNKRPEEKVELYFADRLHEPKTLMIRELKEWLDAAVAMCDQEWERKTQNYWRHVYARFLDAREQALVNFALSRWRVEGITRAVDRVEIDSFQEGNEVFRCVLRTDSQSGLPRG
jgi:hypothetical protein